MFATHSTHKLLAALSQASFLHIRDGRSPIPHSRFNESFMMQASTSPLYPIIVSNDITAAMMDGPGGRDAHRRVDPGGGGVPPDAWAACTGEFAEKKRLVLQDLERGHASRRQGPARRSAFEDASPRAARHRSGVLGAASGRNLARLRRPGRRLLHARPDQGVDRHAGRRRQGRPRQARHPGDAWSPRTCTTAASRSRRPPTSRSWSCSRSASPRASGARCSTRCSISSATTTATRRLTQVLPHLAADHPSVYGGLGLRELADQMFAQLRDSRQTHWLAEAFSTLPKLVMTPSAAYQHLVRDEIEHVPLDKLADRVLATSVVPYPPGIPMLMPGESTGARRRPVSRLPAGAVRRGTSASPASATTRTASRTATASSTCSA